MTRITLHVQGIEQEFEIDRQFDTLHIDNQELKVDCRVIDQDGGSFVLAWTTSDGRNRHLHVAGAALGDRRQLWVDGRTFTYRRVAPRAVERDLAGSLSSSIPAIVTEVLVTAGTAVATGDKLLLLESMKMIIPIQAPFDGVVTAIHCAIGESVQAGIPLLEISEAANT